MKQLKDLLQDQKPIFSFEVFPAKTPEGHTKLLSTLKDLCALNPDFISCTYGAGGGSRDRTFEIVEHIQSQYQVPAMAHLTCISHTRVEIADIFADFKRRGISNVLALRGDPPKEDRVEVGGAEGFDYSSDLVAFIRQHFKDSVSIGVAGFPDKHLLAPSFDADAQFLKSKVDAGADFVITQLFFDNQKYFDYVDRLKHLGVTVPVIPGILPITNYGALVRFCERCGADIPQQVVDLFEPIQEDLDKTVELGIAFAVKQCRELLAGGAPGIHFYALNKVSPVDRILAQVRNQ